MNKTFSILKPDCLERNLQKEILEAIQKAGFIIVQKKEIVVSEATILKHYEEVIAKVGTVEFRNSILDSFVGQKVIILEIGGQENTISSFRELVGATDPAKASHNSIRGKYGEDSMEKAMIEKRMLNNLIHASDSESNVDKELNLWFKK